MTKTKSTGEKSEKGSERERKKAKKKYFKKLLIFEREKKLPFSFFFPFFLMFSQKKVAGVLDVVMAASIFICAIVILCCLAVIIDTNQREQTTLPAPKLPPDRQTFERAWKQLVNDRDAIRMATMDEYENKKKQFARQSTDECVCSLGGIHPYGRHCGFGYGNGRDVPPCDLLDTCCSIHDKCVSTYGYLDCGCTNAFLKCVTCVYATLLFSSNTTLLKNDWTCDKTVGAIESIVAEFKFLMPRCIDLLKLN